MYEFSISNIFIYIFLCKIFFNKILKINLQASKLKAAYAIFSNTIYIDDYIFPLYTIEYAFRKLFVNKDVHIWNNIAS